MTSAFATSPLQLVGEFAGDTRVRRAFEYFVERADEITQEHAAICAIAAPPFGEGPRANFLRNKFRECGLEEVEIDAEGNCLGLRRGKSLRPLMVLSAHLDTVFPEGTNCAVRREGGRLYAPGVADDACGLAALPALARALDDAGIETEGSLLFVATVGEEGEGDLRGVRHLFGAGRWSKEIDAFLSFDGAGVESITHRALASRRYRVTYAGAGGHSWSDFGTASPVHAVGRAIARLVAYPAPNEPRTTFNVGRIAGGEGVNCIAREVLMDVDLRSESSAELHRLDAYFRRAVYEALNEENAARRANTPPLELELKLIGDRPGGETPADSPLVQLAVEATRLLGGRPQLDCASTDANVPIAKRVSAITVGAGGTGGGMHTLFEWYDPQGREEGLQRALLVVLGVVGLR
ncbi:MAG: M20/M25/M40 family metallo-hydrolase [Pyrinomonadaceae bacterium]